MVEIRRDLDAALPAINRLISIEGDIQELVGQLQTLLNEEGKGPPQDVEILPPPAPENPAEAVINQIQQQDAVGIEPMNATELAVTAPAAIVEPMPAKESDRVAVPAAKGQKQTIRPTRKPQGRAATAPQKTISTPAPAGNNHDDVISQANIRLGSHQDKTRVVIESPRSMKFKTDLDNQEHILVVDLSGVGVETARQTTKADALITAIALDGGKGIGDKEKNGQVVFELKKETKIISTSVLPPVGSSRMYRLVIDLQR